MKMNGEIRVPTDRETVWRALNDPEVLKECLPGCQEIEKTSDTEMTATLVIKVGPVKATFAGGVTLSDLDPPNGYTISGQGQGGAAGFASGEAKVRLVADGGEDGRALRRRCEGRRQARADRLAPHRFHRKEALQTVLRQPRRETRWRRGRGSRGRSRARTGARRASPAGAAGRSLSAIARTRRAPADAAQEGAPAEAAGPPLAPSAQRMGLPTAVWVGAVVVVAAVLILVFTGVI